MNTRLRWVALKPLSMVILLIVLSTGCQPSVIPPNLPAPTPTPVPTPTPAVPLLTPLPDALLPTATTKWTVAPGRHLDTTPVVVAGVIYATLEDSCICALDAQTGKVLWRVSPPGLRLTSPVVANGLVYVGMYGDWQLDPHIEQTSYLYALDAHTGAIRWYFRGDRAKGEGASLPVVADGLVYVGTGHADYTGITPPAGMVSALDATTGQVVWQYHTSGAADTGISVGDGLVFFGDGRDYDYSKDHLHAVDARTGQEKWTRELTTDLNFLPLVGNHLLYFGSNGQLFALDPQTGQEHWQRPLAADSFSAPLLGNGTLYFASNQERDGCIDNCPPRHYTDYLSAVDATTGQEHWRVAFTDRGGPFYNLALDTGVLYYTTFRPGALKALDVQTGQGIWQFAAEDAIFGAPALAEGVIYLGVTDGHLYALLPPATRPAP